MSTQLVNFRIPDDLDYSALRMTRDPQTLDVEYDLAPIEAICTLSGIDIRLFSEGPEDNIALLLNQWYVAHLKGGGARDPVQEQLLAEVQAEAAAGGQAGVINHMGTIQ